jgi:type I restriction enzyme S subunit
MRAAELRQSILQAAVQGKLVPQDLHDEPASILLKRIYKKKEQLINDSKIKGQKPLPLIIEDEIPYDLPEGWEWVRLGEIANIIRGASPRPKGDPTYWATERTPYHWIKISDITKHSKNDVLYDTDEFLTKKGTEFSVSVDSNYIITAASGSIGKCALLGIDGYIYDGLIGISLYDNQIDKRYAIYYINFVSPFLVDESTGTSWKNIRTDTLKQLVFPIPPFTEQQRIIAKVDELMALCDELEAAEQELDRLENRFAEFLPKSILQAAVQGKLVSQNMHDEPATVLLECIRAEKARLVKEGKLKEEKPLPPITEDEIPYDLPEGWVWCRLIDVCRYIQRGKSPKYSDIMQIPVISQKCIQWTGIEMDKVKFIEPSSIRDYSEERILKTNDLLWNSTGHGTLGRIMIYDERLNNYSLAVADSHVTVIRPFLGFPLSRYLFFWFSGPKVQNEIVSKSSGSTKQIELATSTIQSYLVPLLPLIEQQRIIAKVDELMILCNELKATRIQLIEKIDTISRVVIDFPEIELEESLQLAARGKINKKPSAEFIQAVDDMFEGEE